MLVSHRERFIYLKTVKTAGTSVEIFLEPHCRDDARTPTHACAEHVSPAGIVGARGPDVDHHRYYNHMPAERVRAAIGEEETLDIVRRMYAPDFDWSGYPRAPEWTEALI